MANSKSNYPTTALDNMNGQEFVGQTISCLMDLKKLGKPKDDAELEKRIDQYFQFCSDRNFRCGIETLCMSLSITRTTLFSWCRGQGCSERRQELALMAKQTIVGFIEAVTLAGKLNPASSCFMLKNWANYQDSVQIETTQKPVGTYLLPAEIARERLITDSNFSFPEERLTEEI